MTAVLEGSEWSAARPGRTLPPRKDQVPIEQDAGLAPDPVWTGGKSRPHGDFFLYYNFIDPPVHKYNGCMEDILVMYSDTSANEDNSFRNHIR